MAQGVQCLLCKQGDLSLDPQDPSKVLGLAGAPALVLGKGKRQADC